MCAYVCVYVHVCKSVSKCECVKFRVYNPMLEIKPKLQKKKILLREVIWKVAFSRGDTFKFQKWMPRSTKYGLYIWFIDLHIYLYTHTTTCTYVSKV